jgi:hypothetical protein
VVSGRASWRGWALPVAALALCALVVTAASSAASGTPQHSAPRAHKPPKGSIHFATTGNRSEILDRVPIARHKWDKKRVVMSLGPGKLPTLHRGDILRTSAEVQISNTCIVFYAVRCIGSHYSYSPREDARIVLANGRRVAGGKGAKTIAKTRSLRCHQPRPDRNHHCVLVFEPNTTVMHHPHHLPCQPDQCHVNVVVEADYPHAHDGQVILIGADRPNGTVRQDKGRLNAIVLRGRVPKPKKFKSANLVSSSVPIAPTGKGGRRVVYSQRINELRKGDVLEVSAKHLMTISSLPYSSFIGTHVILAGSRHGIAAHARDEVTETNGFNCTHGPSAYRNPCLTQKAGAIRIRHTIARHGHPVPIYVNVVATGKAKRTTPGAGDRMHVLSGGKLVVRRFRVP